MIKAQDLRIGNVFRGIGGVQTVLSLEENTDRGKCNYSNEEHRLMYSHLILCHQNGNQYKPFEIEPIQLTEEILLKVGFSQVENYQEGTLGLNGIRMIDHLGEWQWNDFSRNKKVPYLHQLQNLYFALTGQELNTAELICNTD